MRGDSTNSGPIVTIGITTYNRPKMLREAVLSIIGQTNGNFELLIGNDYVEKSVTFDTLGIEPDPRIKILNYSQNMGEVNNMNYLLDLARTEWFTWLADDDVLHQSFIEMSLGSVVDKESVVAVYSEYIAGSFLNKNFFNDIDTCELAHLSANKFIPRYTSRELDLIGCYGLLKTESLRSAGGMPSLGSSFGPYSDTLMPILLSQFGSINYLKTPLCFLRTHDESLSVSSSEIEAYKSSEADFLARLNNVCSSIDNVSVSKCIFNMITWFRDNEFSVISRDRSISRVRVITSFMTYQVKNNYPRISAQYWLRFTFSNIRLVIRVIINSIYKKIGKKTIQN